MDLNAHKPHNLDYVVFLYDQAKALDFSAVFGAGCHDIDAGGVDAAVAQNIRQLRNVFFNAVKCPGPKWYGFYSCNPRSPCRIALILP